MHAPKFEGRSQEETERQERCARGDAWRMAKSILNLNEKDRSTSFSPTEVWCLPASTIKPMQHGQLRTGRCLWFIDWLFQLIYYPASLPQDSVIQYQHEVRVRVAKHAETCRHNQQKPRTQVEMRTTRQYGRPVA